MILEQCGQLIKTIHFLTSVVTLSEFDLVESFPQYGHLAISNSFELSFMEHSHN